MVRVSSVLLFSLLLLLMAPTDPVHSAPSRDSSPQCFEQFASCRTDCITEDTRFFLGLVIDGQTNACFLDCDLGLLGCVKFYLEGRSCGC